MKRLIKLGISLGLRAWDVTRNVLLRLTGRKPAGTCVVIYYHGIRPELRSQFAQQLDTILSVAKPVPADRQDALPAGQHHCIVTFDDGFVSVIENALPELERRKIPATIFVPSGSIGGRPAWIKNSTHKAYHEVVMTDEQMAALHRGGLIIIGSHSISHPNFLSLETERAQQELTESKQRLESALGAKVGLFSFPHGKFNSRLLEQARAAGYDRIFSVEPELALQEPREFVTGRVPVEPDDWPLEFRLKLLGAYRWAAKSH